MKSLQELIVSSSNLHKHVCPRQVLGLRMGILAGELLSMDLPQTEKRLLAIVETDGCFSDGVAVATNCWVGRRTMRVEDYGKAAATFVDTGTGEAWRVSPNMAARQTAHEYAPEAQNRWEAMLLGYQRMPAMQLLVAQPVQLRTPVSALVSHPGHRVSCEQCGEEIINEREIRRDGSILCRSCSEVGYYVTISSETDSEPIYLASPGPAPVLNER